VNFYKEFFYKNQDTFDHIVLRIAENATKNNLIGKRLELYEFDELTIKQLRRLEIEYIVIHETNCGLLEIEFATSWTDYPIGQTYLSYDCSDEKSTKGNYWSDGNFIEVWGLGDNWTIWVDSDFI